MDDNDEPLRAAIRAHFDAQGMIVLDGVDSDERESEEPLDRPPNWIDACPVGEARTLTDKVGDTMATWHRDRRPLGSPVNLDETWVAMDAAEAGGFMGWPPIVGKRVTVGDLVGTVEKVGPLGMLGTWTRINYYIPTVQVQEVRGTIGYVETAGATETPPTVRAVIPWGETISWSE